MGLYWSLIPTWVLLVFKSIFPNQLFLKIYPFENIWLHGSDLATQDYSVSALRLIHTYIHT